MELLGFKNWIDDLTELDKSKAINRLTALWAFVECGLGGMMHLLHSPFTGLIVGGFAMIILCLLCLIAKYSISKVLKSLILVLIVKFTLSPQSPFTAYIAVCFQGLTAMLIFKILRTNLFSILLFCTIAMLESAFQKLLVLTIVFGKAFWVSVDEFVKFVFNQFHYTIHQASYWLVAIYSLIYLVGGIIVGLIANSVINTEPSKIVIEISIPEFQVENKPKKIKNIVYFFCVIIFIALGFFVAGNNINNTAIKIVKILVYAFCMIVLLQFVFNYLLKSILVKILYKCKSKYSQELNQIVDFFPNLKLIIQQSWVYVKEKKGFGRLKAFIVSVIHQSIVS